jgi:hypothetical protein
MWLILMALIAPHSAVKSFRSGFTSESLLFCRQRKTLSIGKNFRIEPKLLTATEI